VLDLDPPESALERTNLDASADARAGMLGPDGGLDGGGGACVLGAEICNRADDDCDGLVDEGFDITSDVSNCGGCGIGCAAAPNAAPVCSGGRCDITCFEGYDDCNGAFADGCESDLGSPMHCGACGVACPVSAPLCSGATCSSVCGGGLTNCGGACVDTTNDARHCGGCDGACNLPFTFPLCEAGHCAVDSCWDGRADCNMIDSDGCEVDVATDVGHCGGCSNACGVVPNATLACSAGTCALASCLTGWEDCNTNRSDGCETDVQSDIAHCGSCTTGCATDQSCVSGVCTLACPVGSGDCNLDGFCESLDFDRVNCGLCGRSCMGAELCCNGCCYRGATCPSPAVC